MEEGLRSIDDVDFAGVFLRRPLVMRSVPRILQGPCTAAMRLALQEASQAQKDTDQVRLARAWKLFLLLPRMLLWRPEGGFWCPDAVSKQAQSVPRWATGRVAHTSQVSGEAAVLGIRQEVWTRR